MEDVGKLKECFDVFDYDGSGYVSSEELLITIKALGMESQAEAVLSIVNAKASSEEMDFGGFLDIFGFNGDSNSE